MLRYEFDKSTDAQKPYFIKSLDSRQLEVRNFPRLAQALNFVIHESWDKMRQGFIPVFISPGGCDTFEDDEWGLILRVAHSYQILEILHKDLGGMVNLLSESTSTSARHESA